MEVFRSFSSSEGRREGVRDPSVRDFPELLERIAPLNSPARWNTLASILLAIQESRIYYAHMNKPLHQLSGRGDEKSVPADGRQRPSCRVF